MDTGTKILIGAALIVGVGYLVWRSRQPIVATGPATETRTGRGHF